MLEHKDKRIIDTRSDDRKEDQWHGNSSNGAKAGGEGCKG